FEQLLFVYACRANAILADFVREVYWALYASGREQVRNDDARDFVARANQEGRTARPWTPGTVRRVAAYLTGSCADFGLLSRGPWLSDNFNKQTGRVRQGRELTHASFEPVYYLVCPPREILAAKRELPAWTARLRNDGWEVTRFSVAEQVLSILREAPLRKV